MYRLSLLVFIFFLIGNSSGQNNTIHGDNFKLNCLDCHSTNSWKIANESKLNFDHNSTGFKLENQHKKSNCKACHLDLVFNKADKSCNSCHADVHQLTVGNDCVRCHNTQNWLVNNVIEIHEQNGFQLLGGHSTLNCIDCHKSQTNLQLSRLGNECVSCHISDFQNTQFPNHISGGYSKNCVECHEPISQKWGGDNFHFFFPLTLGHNTRDCSKCHQSNNYSSTSNDCYTCHTADYNSTNSPNHLTSGFGTNCALCHNTNPGWKPAQMSNHDDAYFPIYSGEHEGKWSSCTSCHLNVNDYSQFSCINCHEHSNASKMADEHDDVGGFLFQSSACYSCHPKGKE
jgi:hypothetical protein